MIEVIRLLDDSPFFHPHKIKTRCDIWEFTYIFPHVQLIILLCGSARNVKKKINFLKIQSNQYEKSFLKAGQKYTDIRGSEARSLFLAYAGKSLPIKNCNVNVLQRDEWGSLLHEATCTSIVPTTCMYPNEWLMTPLDIEINKLHVRGIYNCFIHSFMRVLRKIFYDAWKKISIVSRTNFFFSNPIELKRKWNSNILGSFSDAKSFNFKRWAKKRLAVWGLAKNAFLLSLAVIAIFICWVQSNVLVRYSEWKADIWLRFSAFSCLPTPVNLWSVFKMSTVFLMRCLVSMGSSGELTIITLIEF